MNLVVGLNLKCVKNYIHIYKLLLYLTLAFVYYA